MDDETSSDQDETVPDLPMSDHEVRDRFALMASLDAIKPYLDMLDGFVDQAIERGWTRDQARAVVAYLMGWRPADGTTPDGAP